MTLILREINFVIALPTAMSRPQEFQSLICPKENNRRMNKKISILRSNLNFGCCNEEAFAEQSTKTNNGSRLAIKAN